MSNAQVLEKFGTKRQLLDIIKRRKMCFFGHIKRHDSIIKDILESKVEGRRGRGRPRAAWPGLTVAWQSAPDKPETVDCGASLHVNPSTGRTALQSKVK